MSIQNRFLNPDPDDIVGVLTRRLAAIDTNYDTAVDRRDQKMKAAADAFCIETQDMPAERELVAKLLAIEKRRLGIVDDARMPSPSPLVDWMIRALRATGPKNKEELRELAREAGYADIDGRSIHAVVTNSVRTGRMTQLDDNRYALTASLDIPQGNEITRAEAPEIPFALGDS